MGVRPLESRHRRTITKTISGSYVMTLPIEFVRQLKWKNGQVVKVSRNGKKLVVD